jgi:hypothetical protein
MSPGTFSPGQVHGQPSAIHAIASAVRKPMLLYAGGARPAVLLGEAEQQRTGGSKVPLRRASAGLEQADIWHDA